MTVKFHEVNQSVTLTTAVQLLVFLRVQINENFVIQYIVIELMPSIPSMSGKRIRNCLHLLSTDSIIHLLCCPRSMLKSLTVCHNIVKKESELIPCGISHWSDILKTWR